MEHANFLNRMNQLRAEDRTGVKYILVVIYDDKGVYLSIQYGQVMEGLLQTPCGKVKPQETSIQAIQREVEEEMGLTNLDLKWWKNDPEFDCDIYLARCPKGEKPLQMESEKNGHWVLYSWKEYQHRNELGRTIPTHVSFGQKIQTHLQERGEIDTDQLIDVPW